MTPGTPADNQRSCSVSLARLWSEQGKRAEALELLAPSHEWFAEGCNMRDLKEAKVLLSGLS